MSIRINGNAGVVEQPRKWGGSPVRGTFVIRTWKGPKQPIYDLIPQFQADGMEWELTENGPLATISCYVPSVEAVAGTTEIPVDVWELQPGYVEKDILEADTTDINDIPKDEIRAIREAINNPKEGQSPALTNSTAIELYSLMLDGVRSIRVEAPILTRRRTITRRYAVKEAMTNIGRILSNTYLIANDAAAIPAYFIVDMNRPPFTNTSKRTGLKYGWLKTAPTLTSSAFNKVECVQAWEFGLWPEVIFGTVIT